MLNKIIRDYGYHKNLDAYHPDYVAAWEIAEYVPWLIKRVTEMKAEEKKLKAGLRVDLDAAHAALRTLADAIPECQCLSRWGAGYECTRCTLKHEIGIANNLLGEPASNPLMPELCQPITKRPRALEEFDPREVASIGYEVDRGGDDA